MDFSSREAGSRSLKVEQVARELALQNGSLGGSGPVPAYQLGELSKNLLLLCYCTCAPGKPDAHSVFTDFRRKAPIHCLSVPTLRLPLKTRFLCQPSQSPFPMSQVEFVPPHVSNLLRDHLRPLIKDWRKTHKVAKSGEHSS
jgi:hypothetical protein